MPNLPRPNDRFVKLGLDSFAVSDLAVPLFPLLVQLLSHLAQLLAKAPVTLKYDYDLDHCIMFSQRLF